MRFFIKPPMADQTACANATPNAAELQSNSTASEPAQRSPRINQEVETACALLNGLDNRIMKCLTAKANY